MGRDGAGKRGWHQIAKALWAAPRKVGFNK